MTHLPETSHKPETQSRANLGSRLSNSGSRNDPARPPKIEAWQVPPAVVVLAQEGQRNDYSYRPMTHSDFNHLLSSIKALSPEQMRQLRQQLDRQVAQPKKPTARRPAKPPNNQARCSQEKATDAQRV